MTIKIHNLLYSMPIFVWCIFTSIKNMSTTHNLLINSSIKFREENYEILTKYSLQKNTQVY